MAELRRRAMPTPLISVISVDLGDKAGRPAVLVSDKRRTTSPNAGCIVPGMRRHRRRRVGRVPENLRGPRLTATPAPPVHVREYPTGPGEPK
jgi:hypothetical protein